MKFDNLGLSEPVLRAVNERFDAPTAIQEKAIPKIVEGGDVTAASPTGSGKTLAFAAGVVSEIEPGAIKSIMLTPTRELAQQVQGEVEACAKYTDHETVLIHGGVDIQPQIEQIKEADVVIGTPGRVLDHLGRETLDLSQVEIFVLDEVDEMFDMGFIDDVEEIMSHAPTYKQHLFFSATLSTKVSELAEKHGDNPEEIFLNQQVENLEQVYYDVPDNLKFSLLVHLLREEESDLIMVFCNTRKTTDFVAKNLQEYGMDATAIHGGHSQNSRTNTMNSFKGDDVSILVCTDVAARGIDVPEVSHVYNYDIPDDPKQYVHRIGRTARAGAEGKVINILGSRDHSSFRRIKQDSAHDIERLEKPYVERLDIKWTP